MSTLFHAVLIVFAVIGALCVAVTAIALVAAWELCRSVECPKPITPSRPCPSHDCDVMGGARDEGERLESLYYADIELMDAYARTCKRDMNHG